MLWKFLEKEGFVIFFTRVFLVWVLVMLREGRIICGFCLYSLIFSVGRIVTLIKWMCEKGFFLREMVVIVRFFLDVFEEFIVIKYFWKI